MIIRDVEQRSPEWFAHRLGIPTASEFNKLLTPARLEPSKQLDDYAKTLAAEIWTGASVSTFEGTAATERGTLLEGPAGASYALLTGQTPEQVGLLRSSEYEAAASPDGLLADATVEIKCPQLKQYFNVLAKDECPTDYLLQCQGQILVGWEDGVRYVDLFLYPGPLPDGATGDPIPSRIFRVEPVQKIQDLLKQQIERVCSRRDDYLLMLKANS